MELHQLSGSEAYLTLGKVMLRQGEPVSPRGQETIELVNATVVILDGNKAHVNGTSRKPNQKIAATEALHLVGGISSLGQLDRASNGRFTQFSDSGRLLGAYGPRVFHQLEHVYGLLQRDPDTRQAVAAVWNGKEHPISANDVPCTTTFQFMVRDGKLCMRTTMRSNDIWLGIPYDWQMFSLLQRTMAACLGLKVGWYAHSVGSLHLYERNRDSLEKLLAAGIVDHDSKPLPDLVTAGDKKTFTEASHLARSICMRWGRGKEHPLEKLVPEMESASFCLVCRYVTPSQSHLCKPREKEVCGRNP